MKKVENGAFFSYVKKSRKYFRLCLAYKVSYKIKLRETYERTESDQERPKRDLSCFDSRLVNYH